jgi:phosphoglycerate dehydrogenase-like enzyme
MSAFPARPMIGFAHVAYRFGERFPLRNTGLDFVSITSREDLAARIGELDVLVVSGFWRNDLAPAAKRLRFIQSISAGVDQYDKAVLAAHGIALASAQGANARAVSDHAMALVLALYRRIPEARDNQAKRVWRGMIGDLFGREDELGGKTMLVVGIGGIGGRLARLAKAFDMTVIGIRGNPAAGRGDADEVHGLAALHDVLPRADVVALTCPLTPETTGLIGAEALARMKPGAVLVNVARGKVVDTQALVAALEAGRIAGAALDVTEPEPLPADSPLWAMPNVLITPHTGGETRSYEDNVIDLLLENLGRLGRGERTLKNQIVAPLAG